MLYDEPSPKWLQINWFNHYSSISPVTVSVNQVNVRIFKYILLNFQTGSFKRPFLETKINVVVLLCFLQ